MFIKVYIKFHKFSIKAQRRTQFSMISQYTNLILLYVETIAEIPLDIFQTVITLTTFVMAASKHMFIRLPSITLIAVIEIVDVLFKLWQQKEHVI